MNTPQTFSTSLKFLGTLNFLTDPFYVDKQKKEQHYFSIEGNTQDVVLYAKCNIEGENMFRDRMIGGVFEGSNNWILQ